MTLDEALKKLEEVEASWAARPWEHRLQLQLWEARAQLAKVQRHAEQQGQRTLGDVEKEG